MTAYPIPNPFSQWVGITGLPLTGAKIYVGQPNQDPETHPIAVYQDAALTIGLAQPIRTTGGYVSGTGTPVNAYPSSTPYSIRVRTSAGAEVFYQAIVHDELSESLAQLEAAVAGIFDVYIYASDSPAVFQQKWQNATGQITIQAGDYHVPPLVTSVDGLTIRAIGGHVNIYKSTGGPLWTHSGNYGSVHDITFRGQGGSYGGDNIVLTGQGNQFWNCGSLDAAALSLNSLKYTNVHGSNPVWGKIKIGQSGVATLYSQLVNVYTSTATDGITLIDNGSQIIMGCQIGPLSIQSGTGPAGVNGGVMVGNRILGAVDVGLSSAVFSGNQFGAVAITFGAGTSGCSMDASNLYETGHSITNNGNVNNLIQKNTGAAGTWQLAYGADSASRKMTLVLNDPTQGWLYDGAVACANGYGFKAVNYAGTGWVNLAAIFGSSNNVSLGDNASTTTNIFASGAVGVVINSATAMNFITDAVYPQVDNAVTMGNGSHRISVYYGATGTINTSDGREKRDIRPINETEKAVALELKGLYRAYRMKDSVAQKGSDARIHFGVIAQDVLAAFANHGLDAHDYGLFCYDEWEAQPAQAAVLDDKGAVLIAATAAVEAGGRYGIRYDELRSFIDAASFT